MLELLIFAGLWTIGGLMAWHGIGKQCPLCPPQTETVVITDPVPHTMEMIPPTPNREGK